jgi:hypothetical protein
MERTMEILYPCRKNDRTTMQRFLVSALVLGALLATGCNGDDDDPVAPTNPGGGGGGGSTTLTAATLESLSYTIDGQTHTLTSGSNDVGIVFSNSGEIGFPISSKIYACSFYNFATDENYLEFAWGKFETNPGIPEADEFFGYFSTGAVPYGNTATEVAKAEIRMYDGEPLFTEWSSRCGTQSSPTFNVTSIVEIPNSITYDRVKYRVTFNCKLYNCTGSGVRTITNGTAVVTFENSI